MNSDSTQVAVGENIVRAVRVVRETHRNVHKLFAEMDAVCENIGFRCMSARPLRWLSAAAADGLVVADFIKIYVDSKMSDENQSPKECFGVEVRLDDPESAKIIVAKYTYMRPQSSLSKRISPADHYKFYEPIHKPGRGFAINSREGYTESVPRPSVKKTWEDLLGVRWRSMELVSIRNRDDVHLLFDTMRQL